VVDFELLFRQSPNPYMVVDRDLRYLAVNDAYASILSTTVDALVGRRVFDAFPGEVDGDGRAQAEAVRHSILRAFATGHPDMLALVPFTIERETAAGRAVEVRYWSATHTPLFDREGHVYAVLQHTTDVTEVERNRAELEVARQERGATPEQLWQGVVSRARAVQDANSALEAQRRHMQALFAQAPGFMAVLSGDDYRFEIANPAYEALVGKHDFLGMRLVDVLPEIAEQGYINLLDQVRETGRRFVGRGMEVHLVGTGGELHPRFVDFVYQPIVGDDDRVYAIFVQGSDVTDREAALAALRDADQRKDRFLATLAHELRNPLAPIGTAATLLRIAHDQPSRVQEASAIIERQVRHVTHLVNDLLDVSRVTRGLAILEVREMDLARSLREALEQIAPLVARKHHELHVSLPDAPVLLHGDPARMTQVFANLLSNAAKYTPDGGRIDVSCFVDDERACIDIEDNGIGLDATLIPHVFDLFVQAEPTPDRNDGGLGIGLALARSLVQLQGGSIEAHSAGLGKGSRFRVCLPVHVNAPGVGAPA
jgi:signal transduction histidine kinase